MTFKQRLVTALEAMPKKELIRGSFNHNGYCCAVGALLKHEGFEKVLYGSASFRLLGVEPEETRNATEENDDFKGTNEARYAHVLEWARK